MDQRHRGISRSAGEVVNVRKTSRSAAYGTGTSDKLSQRASQAARTTPSDRHATRFTNIAPKDTSATRSSPEEDFSTTSFSCSPTPDSGANSSELAHDLNYRLSLEAESLPTAPVAYNTDNWRNVPPSGRSGHNSNSHTAAYAAQGFYDTSGQPVLNAPRKGKQGKANRPDGDEGDDEQDGRNLRSNRKPEGDLKGFPCPYWKKFPQAGLVNSCRKSSFQSIPRLKEHLRRVHYKPSLCSRCYHEVEDLHQHERMNPPCRINSDACRLKFGDAQYRSLQDKMRGKTEMEKWRGIWSVLFHEFDQDNIPLPNAAEDMSTQQKDELINSLEQSISSSLVDWQQQLDQQIQQGYSPAANGVLDIAWIVDSLRIRLNSIFGSYRDSHTTMDFQGTNAAEGVHTQDDDVGVDYPMQSPHNDLPADTEDFHAWFPHDASQYDDFYDGSGYNNN